MTSVVLHTENRHCSVSLTLGLAAERLLSTTALCGRDRALDPSLDVLRAVDIVTLGLQTPLFKCFRDSENENHARVALVLTC